jgi:hypothetical protein
MIVARDPTEQITEQGHSRSRAKHCNIETLEQAHCLALLSHCNIKHNPSFPLHNSSKPVKAHYKPGLSLERSPVGVLQIQRKIYCSGCTTRICASENSQILNLLQNTFWLWLNKKTWQKLSL